MAEIKSDPEFLRLKYLRYFTQPLTFGEPVQIKYLRQWRHDLDEYYERQEARRNAVLKKFRVKFTHLTVECEIVEALDAEDAEDKIRDDYYEVDDIISVREEGGKKDG